MTVEDINILCRAIYNQNKAKGFWDDNPKDRNFGELLMLVTSELGEALEADRKGNRVLQKDLQSVSEEFDEGRFKELIKDTVEDEVADAVIRLFDMCGALNIDLGKHMELKLRYNDSRESKHGKAY